MISESVKYVVLLHIIVTYIKENRITKVQKLYSPPRNLRADNKLPALFLKKPLGLGNLSPAHKIMKGLQNVGSLLFSPMKPVLNQYKVAFSKIKLDQVLTSSSELIISALDLSVDELTGCASSKIIQEYC